MGVRSTKGFTIVEATLFLAISGLLIMLMILGSGASINIQRYKDATTTFKDLVQQQYAAVASVQNSRDEALSCNSATARINDSGAPENLGQSDCFLMGKYLYINKDKIKTYDILGGQGTTQDTSLMTDILALQTYKLNLSDASSSDLMMEWGTSIKTLDIDGRTGSDRVGILFLKAPNSGNVYTLSSTSVPDDPTLINSAAIMSMVASQAAVTDGQKPLYICVSPTGLVMPDASTALYIGANSTSTSSIETRTNALMRQIYADANGGNTTGAPQC